jgi:hypothetical protein
VHVVYVTVTRHDVMPNGITSFVVVAKKHCPTIAQLCNHSLDITDHNSFMLLINSNDNSPCGRCVRMGRADKCVDQRNVTAPNAGGRRRKRAAPTPAPVATSTPATTSTTTTTTDNGHTPTALGTGVGATSGAAAAVIPTPAVMATVAAVPKNNNSNGTGASSLHPDVAIKSLRSPSGAANVSNGSFVGHSVDLLPDVAPSTSLMSYTNGHYSSSSNSSSSSSSSSPPPLPPSTYSLSSSSPPLLLSAPSVASAAFGSALPLDPSWDRPVQVVNVDRNRCVHHTLYS